MADEKNESDIEGRAESGDARDAKEAIAGALQDGQSALNLAAARLRLSPAPLGRVNAI